MSDRTFGPVVSARDPAWRAFGALMLITLAPVWLVAELPLLDLPNHLARAVIYLHLSEPPFSSQFTWEWTLVPNLAAEGLTIGLVALCGPVVGGKLLVTLILVLLGSGALGLQRAIFDRFSVAPLFGIPFLLNGVVQHGFVSYLLGVALALFALMFWVGSVRGHSRGRRWLLGALVFALFFAHLYAFAVFYWFATVYLAASWWRDRDGAAVRRELLLLVSYAVLPVLAFLLLSPTVEPGSLLDYASVSAGLFLKIGFFWIFFGSAFPILGAILLSLSVFGLLSWARRSQARVQLLGVSFLITGVVLYLVLPFTLFSSNNADWRILLPLTLIGFACVVGPPRSDAGEARSATGHALALLAVLAFVRAGATYVEWSRSAAVFDEYRAVTEEVPVGAKLFVAALGVPRTALILPVPVWHVGAISVIEKRAIIQRMFANPRQQPLRYRPEAEALREGIERIHYRPNESTDWTRVLAGFDYILLLRPEGLGSDLPEPFPQICTAPAGRTRDFHLYRVVRDPPGCGGAVEGRTSARRDGS